MKKNYKYILILLLLLSSCFGRKKYYYIDEDLKFKLQDEKIFIFQNQDKLTDTFDLFYGIDERPQAWVESCNIFYEIETVSLVHRHNSLDTSNYSMSIYKTAEYKIDDDETISRIHIDKFWIINSNDYIEFYESMQVNSENYENVYLY